MIGTRALAAGVLCWLVCGGSAAALERKPLPPFHALTPAGAAVGSDRLSTEIRWLLVYLTPTNPSSARLLSALMLVSMVAAVLAGAADCKWT